MKARYRLIRRGIRGGAFYSVDTKTGRRSSLGTANPDEAAQIIEAKNIAERQPVLNLQIAKAYLAGTDSGLTTRTWQQAMETLMEGKQGANRERWSRVATDRALAPLLPRTIVDTPGELMLKVLQSGTVSTNVFLRRLHNFCLDMNWLAWPLVPKRQYAFTYDYSLTTVTIGNGVTSIGDDAFDVEDDGSLTSVYFMGNAPAVHSSFRGDFNATAYYLPGTTGWSRQFLSELGLPGVLWNPVIQTGSIGVQNNQFGFNITCTNNVTVVVEACTNLASLVWVPLMTSTFVDGFFHFSDPQWTNYSARYYRLQMP